MSDFFKCPPAFPPNFPPKIPAYGHLFRDTGRQPLVVGTGAAPAPNIVTFTGVGPINRTAPQGVAPAIVGLIILEPGVYEIDYSVTVEAVLPATAEATTAIDVTARLLDQGTVIPGSQSRFRENKDVAAAAITIAEVLTSPVIRVVTTAPRLIQIELLVAGNPGVTASVQFASLQVIQIA